MKLGIISDTHDNLPAIAAAVEIFKKARVQAILHAGDYVARSPSRGCSRPGCRCTACSATATASGPA